MNKLRLWFMASVVIIPVAGFAQPANPDSLRAVVDGLHAKGDSLLKASQYADAIAPFEQEIELRKQLADTVGWCAALNRNSQAHWRSGDYERAVGLAEEALRLGIEAFGETDTLLATSYYNLGAINYMLGSFKDALEHFEMTLEIRLNAFGPVHPSVAASYNNIGAVYDNLGDYQEALENYERSLAIWLKALGPEHPDVATSHNNVGAVYYNLGKYEQALENFEKALAIRLKTLGPEHPDVATSYNDIGNVYWELGDYQLALEYHEKALDIQLKVLGPEHPYVATSYNNIGNVYGELGDYQLALEYHEKALDIQLKVLGPEHPDVADSYGNFGNAYFDLGVFQRALENHEKALAISLKTLGPEHPHVAYSYINIGNVYGYLGDYQRALENFEKALEIFLNAFGLGHSDVAKSYNNIGNVYLNLGDYQGALENFEKALAIKFKALGLEHPSVAGSYTNIGNVYGDLGDYQGALENLEKALEIFLNALGPEHPEVASCYNAIGNVYEDIGDYECALENHVKALAVWLKVFGHEHPDVAASYSNIGDVYRAQDKSDSALVYYKKSIDIFEKSRGKIESEELRKSYTETVTDRYEAIISLLLEMDKPEEAFEYLERSKSKALKDIIEEKYDLELGSGEIKEMIKQTRVLATKIEVLGNQLLEERLEPDSIRNGNKVENLSRLLDEVHVEYDSLVAEIEADPDYAFVVRIEPVKLSDIRDKLPERQKLLMVYSGAEELYLFLVSREGYEGKSVTVSRDSLDNFISLYRRLCGTRKARKLYDEGLLLGWSWEDDGSEFYKEEVEPLKNILMELYSYLIEPLEGSLESAEIVTIIPSGNLYYLPWGALLDQDGVFFTERYNWHVMTSTELLRSIQRRESSGRRVRSIALVGNPTGANLPGAADEVNLISDNYRRSTILQGEEATEERVGAVSGESQVLHLATHARLKKDSPWESYIFLAEGDSSNGRWTVAEISGQSWKRMQLVTLSACESGLGGKYPGLEFESLAKAFTLAMESPPSIIATLSSVHDESTKEFMVTFYEELKRNPKSEALRLAQQKLIHSGEYAHPFFWAPFILIGEWR